MFSHVLHWHKVLFLDCEVSVKFGKWTNPPPSFPFAQITYPYSPSYLWSTVMQKKQRSKSTSTYMQQIWSPGEGRIRAESFPSKTSWLWFSSIISQLILKRTHVVRLLFHVMNEWMLLKQLNCEFTQISHQI